MKQLRVLLLSVLMVIISMVPTQALESNDYDVFGDTYDVDITVKGNGQIEYNINLAIDFNEPRQGVYFNVPQSHRMSMKLASGASVDKEYFFPITNISSSHNMKVSKDRKWVNIRLGQEGHYQEGRVNYQLHYTMNTYDLDLEGLQMVYIDLMPNGLDYPVRQLNYVVRFDEDVQGDYFIYPPSGEVQKLKLDNNEIRGSYDFDGLHETVTLEVPLENNYFTFPTIDYIKPALFLGLLVAVVVIGIYWLFGRDPIVVESVEFAPPEGISSGEVGYIYRGMVLSKDVVSFIVYWASKGYIIIHEDKKKISLEKIKDLPQGWNAEEMRLFNKIFESGDLVTMKSLEKKVGPTVQHVQAAIPKRFTKNKAMHVFDRKSSMMKILSVFLVSLIPAFMGYAVVLLRTSYVGDARVGFFVAYGVFFIMSCLGAGLLAFDRVYKKSHRAIYLIAVLLPTFLIGFVLSLIFGSADNELVVFSTLLVYSVSLLFVANTSRRTQQGADWVGQIRGLKRFIEVAEKDRLIQLVEETPYLFYDILPYAYVLGISDVWIKRFEGITLMQPDWYVSTSPNLTTYLMLNNLNRSMNRMNTSITSMPASTSSGGGSFGGGGGGGFSGGGFGGGGGGSW